MVLRKLLLAVPAVFVVLALSGCGTEDNLAKEGDPPEVTCDRLHGVVDEFRDIDAGSVGLGDMLSVVNDGFAEIETIADEAQDEQLGTAIDTVAESLNDSIAASGGDIDAVRDEFQAQLQEPETQEAATYINDVCGLEMSF